MSDEAPAEGRHRSQVWYLRLPCIWFDGQVEYSMFCRVALPKNRTLTADDEVILCSWQRVNAPKLLYLTCNVVFTVDITDFPGKPSSHTCPPYLGHGRS